jgi:hypothetical protein
MPYKPIAIMIKNTYTKLIRLWVAFTFLGLLMGYICETTWWGFILLIPIVLIIWYMWKLEKDIKDYLISI